MSAAAALLEKPRRGRVRRAVRERVTKIARRWTVLRRRRRRVTEKDTKRERRAGARFLFRGDRSRPSETRAASESFLCRRGFRDCAVRRRLVLLFCGLTYLLTVTTVFSYSEQK